MIESFPYDICSIGLFPRLVGHIRPPRPPVEQKKRKEGSKNRSPARAPFPRGKKGLSAAKGEWQNAVGGPCSNKPEMVINHDSKKEGNENIADHI